MKNKSHGWGTFSNYRIRLIYCFVLGPYLGNALTIWLYFTFHSLSCVNKIIARMNDVFLISHSHDTKIDPFMKDI
jgi:hypothetical protein